MKLNKAKDKISTCITPTKNKVLHYKQIFLLPLMDALQSYSMGEEEEEEEEKKKKKFKMPK